MTWVPVAKADMKPLLAQHQRVFPGNQLAVVHGYVKVSVLDGEKPAANAITTDAAKLEWAKRTAIEPNFGTDGGML